MIPLYILKGKNVNIVIRKSFFSVIKEIVRLTCKTLEVSMARVVWWKNEFALWVKTTKEKSRAAEGE